MAIDPKELRLGNYVQTRCGTVLEVFSIGRFSVMATKDKTFYGSESYIPMQLGGIPITEQLLKDFGFELGYESSYCKKYTHKVYAQIGYDIDEADGAFFRYYGRYMTCEYVHSLQNLSYALGHELKLQNDK